MDSSDQWLFPLSALRDTPSEITLQEEMSRRQKGVDWLFRVGVSLGMSVSSPGGVTAAHPRTGD